MPGVKRRVHFFILGCEYAAQCYTGSMTSHNRNTELDFWSQLAPPDYRGCRRWTGHKTRDGYGRWRFGGRQWLTSRLAWTLSHGPIPSGVMVLHTCDVPQCCALEHLYLGTAADNVRDMYQRGRAGTHRKRHGRRLTREQAYELRAWWKVGGWKHRELAAAFGVSVHTSESIVQGRCWRE